MVAMINDNFVTIEEEAMVFREQFQEYSYLWLTDLNASFETFLETAWEEVLDDDGEPTGRRRLALETFDAEIIKYREKQTEVAELAHTSDVIALRINSQPIKQALSTWATKWIYLYTQYLQEHVEDQLNEIHSFMQGASSEGDCTHDDRTMLQAHQHHHHHHQTGVISGLGLEVVEGDFETLMTVMAHIRDVRKSMDDRKESFGPLRDAVLLLKAHGIDMSNSYIDHKSLTEYLDELPLQWENIVNMTFKKKEVIQPLQNKQADSTKKDIVGPRCPMMDHHNRQSGELTQQRTPIPRRSTFKRASRALSRDLKSTLRLRARSPSTRPTRVSSTFKSSWLRWRPRHDTTKTSRSSSSSPTPKTALWRRSERRCKRSRRHGT